MAGVFQFPAKGNTGSLSAGLFAHSLYFLAAWRIISKTGKNKIQMIKNIQTIHPVIFILIAAIFEISGDAIIRASIYHHTGLVRAGLMLLGAILLFSYGLILNLAPVEFGQVVGIYVAFVFIFWQVGNYIAFRTLPTLPIMVGGALVIAGGLIITFWKTT